VTHVEDTHYVLGSAAGPHPFPWIVRELQSVIGREAREQALAQVGRLPDAVVACVGGGSNAIGLFSAFIDDAEVALVAVEAAGEGLDSGRHGAALSRGRPGGPRCSRSYLPQGEDGQVAEAHSISAGLDYPGVGPELASLKDSGRMTVASATDSEALQALLTLTRVEGILPAMESAHAISGAMQLAAGRGQDEVILVGLSGRGDKDLGTVAKAQI